MVSGEYKVDRSGWRSGPWDNEPDRIEWITALGYPAIILRNDAVALCGYVGVPRGHAAYGKQDFGTSVHGGLTYGSRCYGHVCHMPRPGESDDVFWHGFDCAHYGDSVPLNTKYGLPEAPDAEYRDVDYVRAECESLALTLHALEVL